MARKAKLSQHSSGMRGRMSCVDNSDILRSARNALNQYPRFPLDGRDATYRSSFGGENDLDHNKGMCFLSPTLAGESLVWCKPGFVAKLVGLEAMPVPVGRKGCDNKEKLSAVVRRQNLRKRFERNGLERKLLTMEMQQYQDYHNNNIRKHTKNGCCSKNGYCIVKPVALETLAGCPGSWQPRRYA